MKINQLFAGILFCTTTLALTSCGGGAFDDLDWEDPRDRELTAEDTTMIDEISPKLEGIYNYIVTDTLAPDTTIGKLPSYSYDKPNYFKLKDLGSIYDTDSVYNFTGGGAGMWSMYKFDETTIEDIKTTNYNGELADDLAEMAEQKYILVLQDLLQLEPELKENEFNSGLYFGTIYIFDYETTELKRKFSILAENSESVSYYDYQSETSLQQSLERDLAAQISETIKDSISDAFLPYSN